MATDEELLAAINAGPTGGTEQGLRAPIGISEGGEVELAERGVKPPRYTSGYEFFPGSQTPEWRARLQLALDAAGMYGNNPQYRRGVWDPEVDAKAFNSILGVANTQGWTWQEALTEMGRLNAEGRGVGGRGGGGRGGRAAPSITVEVSNPDDLRVLADRVSRSSIGKKLEPEQMENFVKAYQAIEQGAAQQQIAAAGREGSTILAGPPSAETFAQQQIEQTQPGEVKARAFVEKFAVFNDLLGGTDVQAARPGAGGGTTGI